MKKDETKKVVKKEEGVKTGRRKFLKTAAAAAGAASVASIGFPMVSRAQTTVIKMQGAWGAKDIFNDFAMDYVKRVNEMAGGRLKIQYLISGAVVKAFRVQDAVHKGVLDAGHQVLGGDALPAPLHVVSPCAVRPLRRMPKRPDRHRTAGR